MTETDFALLGIDAVTIAKVWGWGFATVIFFWSLGYTIGCAVGVIKRL